MQQDSPPELCESAFIHSVSVTSCAHVRFCLLHLSLEKLMLSEFSLQHLQKQPEFPEFPEFPLLLKYLLLFSARLAELLSLGVVSDKPPHRSPLLPSQSLITSSSPLPSPSVALRLLLS